MLTFAIVIPNLNQSHFLPFALESLRYQSALFNLAIMDGGSSDNFREVTNQYSDIISFIRSEPDNGQAAAIKEGIAKVRGNIVTWLNSDDYYFPDMLDKVLLLFEERPDIDVIYGDAIHVSPEGFFLSYFPAIEDFNGKRINQTNFICQPACFVRRTALDRVGGLDTTLNYTMDWDLWCRLYQTGAKFLYVKEVFAAVRYYPGTKTLSKDWARYKELWRIQRKYGRRILPLVLLKFYLFDLNYYKNNSTALERALRFLLSTIRGIKRSIKTKESRKSIHGFQPWSNTVDGQANVFIPWYGDSEWKRLLMSVFPLKGDYTVGINGFDCGKPSVENDRLAVALPSIKEPKREISKKKHGGGRWSLHQIAWEV